MGNKDGLEKEILEILKPLCSIHKAEKMNYMYLRCGGVVVKRLDESQFKKFDEWLKK